ncbi:hypothetical protein Salat_2109000 [Sesamum alatum]|uniref:Uncharacterized protein n=1 Tax=Sesamum alatum TaxID=300844 RepID=A0AAE1Y0V9_9LAMI|nr:hypothetical protein Salat_2109000 [Sesamum alatum]
MHSVFYTKCGTIGHIPQNCKAQLPNPQADASIPNPSQNVQNSQPAVSNWSIVRRRRGRRNNRSNHDSLSPMTQATENTTTTVQQKSQVPNYPKQKWIPKSNSQSHKTHTEHIIPLQNSFDRLQSDLGIRKILSDIADPQIALPEHEELSAEGHIPAQISETNQHKEPEPSTGKTKNQPGQHVQQELHTCDRPVEDMSAIQKLTPGDESLESHMALGIPLATTKPGSINSVVEENISHHCERAHHESWASISCQQGEFMDWTTQESVLTITVPGLRNPKCQLQETPCLSHKTSHL